MTEKFESYSEGTFGERFADMFQVLEDHAFGPQWQPMAKEITRDVPTELQKFQQFGPAALINCASGPIETVELRATTGAHRDEGPYETTRRVDSY